MIRLHNDNRAYKERALCLEPCKLSSSCHSVSSMQATRKDSSSQTKFLKVRASTVQAVHSESQDKAGNIPSDNNNSRFKMCEKNQLLTIGPPTW